MSGVHPVTMAARNGHEAIVRLCHEWGAGDVNRAMVEAAENGHESIVRLCHDEWGALAMIEAAKGGHVSIMQLCREWGALFG
jgi:hypothetical protein